MARKRKPEKAPAVDKLFYPALGICLALVCFQIFKNTGGFSGESIQRIQVEESNELELREVFFGEVSGKDNYVVLCHSDEPTSPSSKPLPLSSVFVEAWKSMSSSGLAHFRLLDCTRVLPTSNQTIAKRFNLNLKRRPTIFVSGATVGPPKQVPEKHLKTGKLLDKLLKNMLEPRAAKIETTQDLRTKCLNQPYCGLLLKSSKTVDKATKSAVRKLLAEQPKVSFCSIDTSVLYALHLEEFLPEQNHAGLHRFVMLKKVSGGLQPKDSRLISSIAPLNHVGVSYGQMSNLVSSVLSGSSSMQQLSTLPVVKTRTKKLEETERAKRQRKKERAEEEKKEKEEQQQRKATANDGSKEGRRLERERRRAEHYANQNIKPKTPEEIAEMERQRRLRMEEAANAWVIQDGDEEEGQGQDKDGNSQFHIEDDEEELQDLEEEDSNQEDDEEEDEDVLDLD